MNQLNSYELTMPMYDGSVVRMSFMARNDVQARNYIMEIYSKLKANQYNLYQHTRTLV